MSRYRKIDPRIWNDEKFRSLPDRAKLLFFMLLTHPNMTSLGAMRATLPGLAEELGWELEAFTVAFDKICTKGMAEHDRKACFVALPKFLRYNPPESPNVVKAWVASLDLLPECSLKARAVARARAFAEGMTKGFAQALPEAFSKAMPYQEQEQEQEQDEPKGSSSGDAARTGIDPVDSLKKKTPPKPKAEKLKPPKAEVGSDDKPGASVWAAYVVAMMTRYKAAPERDVKLNSHCKLLVTRVGAEMARQLVTWYVLNEHQAQYVSRSHPLSLCVQNCDGITVNMKRGMGMTRAEANQADKDAGQQVGLKRALQIANAIGGDGGDSLEQLAHAQAKQLVDKGPII